MKKIILHICTLVPFFAGLICTQSTNAQWVQTNGPYGGAIGSIVASGTYLFATSNDGVFLSTNNGTSWKTINNGLTNLDISSLVISGTNLFASTGSAGVFLSSDTGKNWSAVNNGLADTAEIWSLAAIGTNIFAAAYISGNNNGIYLSNDTGKSWIQVNNGFPNDLAYCLLATGTNLFAGTYNSGIYLSSDSGKSWTAINNGLTGKTFYALAISGTNLFAGSDGQGIFLSKDTGASWMAVSNGLTGDATGIFSLTASGTNVFTGTADGIFLSVDTGATWVPSNNGFPSLPYDYAYTVGVNGSNIYASVGNQLFLTSDTGSNWNEVSGVTNTDILSLVANGTNIFAGLFNGGVFLSTDSGGHWTAVDNGLTPITYVYSLAKSGSNVLAGTDQGVFLSTDIGASWTALYYDSVEFDDEITALAINGTDIFAGDQGTEIISSNNNGASWTSINYSNGYTGNDMTSIAISGSNIFVGTQFDGVYLSTDSGVNWAVVNNGLTDTTVYSLVVSGTNIFAATGDGVFVSGNNGGSWSAVNNGLTDTKVLSLAISETNIFAGTSGGGVFLSPNNGVNWAPVNDGWTNGIVQSLVVNGANIFAGTFNAGVWKRALSDIPLCGASFTIVADTSQLHNYIVTSGAYGKLPLSYVWSWGDGRHDTIPYPSHTYADSGFYNICLSITDSTGCQSTYCDSSFHALRTTNTMVYITVVNPLNTGIKEVSLQTPRAFLYPNPATNQLTIHTSSFRNEAVTVSVMNVLGQETSPKESGILRTPPTILTPALSPAKSGTDAGEGVATIDVSKLPAGMYFLQLKSESGSVVKKFVKE